MFWAWEKHLVWREAMREEGRVEGREEMRAAVKQRDAAVKQRDAAVKQRDKVLARVAEEKGLTLSELLEQEGVK